MMKPTFGAGSALRGVYCALNIGCHQHTKTRP